MNHDKKYGFATLAIHGHKHINKHEGEMPIRSVSTPIYPTSTFAFETVDEGAAVFAGEKEGYVYTRLGNPTQAALENDMAFLESGEAALAFGSGMAAISSVTFSLARPGDNLVAFHTAYGGTHAFFDEMCPRYQIEPREVDFTDLAKVEAAVDDKTSMIFFETPANPTLEIVDIEGVVAIGKKHGVKVVLDNTFATPYLQNPLETGIDIVVHSATKYLSGHGDTIAGMAVGKKDFIHALRMEYLKDFGGVISPFAAWLILRGIKTLPVRMDRHCATAMEVAQFLSFHPKVKKVYYPGLRTHPQHELAKRQMRDFGGMISFELKGGRQAGRAVCNAVEIFALAVSLGDCDSLIEHPATMTHSTYSEEDLKKAGIDPGLVRLSIGLEDVDDIIEDLRQALRRV